MKNPFDDFDKAEFKMRFRLAKITVKKLLEDLRKSANSLTSKLHRSCDFI